MAKKKTYVVSEKKKLHVYVLDWHTEEPDEDDTLSAHYQKNMKVYRFFSLFVDCEITKVKFKTTDTPLDVLQYFRDAFEHFTDDDAILMYYEGDAGECDIDYEWKFQNGPKSPVDAYELIQLLYDSGLHISLVLDAYIPTRYKHKWIVRTDRKGCVEITSRCAFVQNFKGEQKEGHKSDFTDNMIKSLKNFVRKIDEPTSEGGWRGRVAVISAPQIMAINRAISFNPIRIFDKRPRAGDDTPIPRFVIKPDDVRMDGKISMRMKIIVDKEDEEEISEPSDAPAIEEHEDEGFEEGPEESLFVPADEQKSDPNGLAVL